MTQKQNPSLPSGWRIETLGAITKDRIDQLGPSALTHGVFVYVDIGSVDNQTKRITNPKQLSTTAAPSRAKQNLRTDDVIVSMTRPNLNAVAMVPNDLDGAIGSTGFHVLRPTNVLPTWLYYTVQTTAFISAMLDSAQGVLYPAVRPKDIREFSLPLPPEPEQRRIVTLLEANLTRGIIYLTHTARIMYDLLRRMAFLPGKLGISRWNYCRFDVNQ